MGLRIKTNVESLQAQRQLSVSRGEMETSLERLSSGQRINKSSDDAAGLAVSETMKAKIRGLGQAKRNASDGISYLQVAEGGLNEVNNTVVRMRELVTQAASETLGTQEREFLNKEFTQLGKEVNRIKNEAEFNGRKVLSPSNGEPISIQVGVSYRGKGSTAEADADVVKIELDQLQELNDTLDELKDLNITGENGRELSGDTNAIFEKLDNAMSNVTGFRATVGSIQSRLNSAITGIDVTTENLNAAQSRIRDVDYAAETAKLTQAKILNSAGTAVLSQANALPENVMQLLRG